MAITQGSAFGGMKPPGQATSLFRIQGDQPGAPQYPPGPYSNILRGGTGLSGVQGGGNKALGLGGDPQSAMYGNIMGITGPGATTGPAAPPAPAGGGRRMTPLAPVAQAPSFVSGTSPTPYGMSVTPATPPTNQGGGIRAQNLLAMPRDQYATLSTPASLGGRATVGGGNAMTAWQNSVGNVNGVDARGNPIGGGASGGSSGGIPQTLQDLQNQANAANLQRYKQGAGVITSGYDTILQRLGQQSNAQAVQNAKLLQQQQADLAQSQINRGLSNTTAGQSMGNQLVNDSALRGAQIQDQLLQNELGYRQNYANQLSNWIGSRTDVGPNMGAWSGLLSQPGAYGGVVNQGLLAPRYGGVNGGTGFGALTGPMAGGQPYSNLVGGYYNAMQGQRQPQQAQMPQGVGGSANGGYAMGTGADLFPQATNANWLNSPAATPDNVPDGVDPAAWAEFVNTTNGVPMGSDYKTVDPQVWQNFTDGLAASNAQQQPTAQAAPQGGTDYYYDPQADAPQQPQQPPWQVNDYSTRQGGYGQADPQATVQDAIKAVQAMAGNGAGWTDEYRDRLLANYYQRVTGQKLPDMSVDWGTGAHQVGASSGQPMTFESKLSRLAAASPIGSSDFRSFNTAQATVFLQYLRAADPASYEQYMSANPELRRLAEAPGVYSPYGG